jgi:transcription elongation GreA/GreB family factor
MSRAFTKEIDDVAPLPLPERPISAAANLVTPRGAELIEQELARLGEKLRSSDAGDGAEIRRDQRYWTRRQASMQVITPDANPTVVGFGVRVRIRRNGRMIEVRIVGEDEADPKENLIAWTSPLAVALNGSEVGDVVELRAGGRLEPLEVLAVLA